MTGLPPSPFPFMAPASLTRNSWGGGFKGQVHGAGNMVTLVTLKQTWGGRGGRGGTAGAPWLCAHIGFCLSSSRQTLQGKDHATLTGPSAQHGLRAEMRGDLLSLPPPCFQPAPARCTHCPRGVCQVGPLL